MNQSNEDLKIPHWQEIQGNKFRWGIDARMLTDKGYAMRVKSLLIGECKGSSFSMERLIIFDRQYVVQKIVKTIIKPLSELKYPELQKLIAECWRANKDA